MVGLAGWMTLGGDPRPDVELPTGVRDAMRTIRRAGFGCRYAGCLGDDEVFFVRSAHRGGSLRIDRAAGTLELWSPVDPNGSPAAWTRAARAGTDAAAVGLLVEVWGRPADRRAAVRVRAAQPADATEIAGVHVRAWQHAYRGILPDDVLDALDPVARATSWRERLARPPGPQETVLAEDADDVVGFAATCPSRDPDTAAGTGELAAIYVDPTAARIGVGRRLMSEAVDRLRTAGHTRATLWVLAANTTAIAFYGRMGWTPDGAARQEAFGGRSVAEVRYHRLL